jgi:rRNA-processing protein FCF1
VALKIILDSNFLLIPAQFRLDIFEAMTTLINRRHEPIVLSTTKNELRKMVEKGAPKLRKQAKMALELAEKCQLAHVERKTEESNDDVIVRIAAQWKCPVATNDSELRQRLRDISIPVVYLRQKSRLELEGSL